VVTIRRDAEFAEYVSARLPTLRRLALLLCQDWHTADDLVQAAIVKLFLQWPRAKGADNIDAYVRAIVVREFLHDRRTSWARHVRLTDQMPEVAAAAADSESSLDLQAAVAALPPRQRAVLVLRFYCDLNVDQSASVLGCSPGTVKSQTAKALNSLRQLMDAPPESATGNTASRTADWPTGPEGGALHA
jgi:RNA polymerase sigma-70 factor (sigma-E family)